MISKIRKYIHNKKILILGFGKEGKSTFRMLKQVGGYAQLDIADQSPVRPEIEETHQYLTGEGYTASLDDYDIVFKSPGIVLPQNPEAYHCHITSQTDLFLSKYRSQTIGITGTKGKSTTSTLLYHVLKENGFDCILAGNIGIPVFDIIDKISNTTIIVLELSCHQLEFCHHSPAISVLLNLYEDHLDHYITVENYINAKKNIYLHQFVLDTLYCNEHIIPTKEECIARALPVTTACLPFERMEHIDGAKLRGEHNLINCAFVYLICKSFSVTDEQFIKSIASYQPLPHRLEYIGTKKGVDYYDDSISTTVESAISAVTSVPNAKYILLGGMDRGIDYHMLVDFLLTSKLNTAILMYESGRKIYHMLQEKMTSATTTKFQLVSDLYEAINWVKDHAEEGSACLLSPAAASYGDFKNFEERGNVFKDKIFGN